MGIFGKKWIRRIGRRTVLNFGEHMMYPFYEKLTALSLKVDHLIDNRDGSITFLYSATDEEYKELMDYMKTISPYQHECTEAT